MTTTEAEQATALITSTYRAPGAVDGQTTVVHWATDAGFAQMQRQPNDYVTIFILLHYEHAHSVRFSRTAMFEDNTSNEEIGACSRGITHPLVPLLTIYVAYMAEGRRECTTVR